MKATFTNSIPSAAFAVSKGAPAPRFEEYQHGRYQMFFDEDPDGEIGRTLSEYFSGATVVANDFYSALQDIRIALNIAKGGVR